MVKEDGIENPDQPNDEDAGKDNESTRSHKMKEFFNNTSTNANNAFSGRNFRNRNATNIEGSRNEDDH